MPDATITSTASTFGTISGVFSADQSTISGTISGIVPGTLTGSVGVPGPQGPAGIGLPAGGTSGQFLQKTSGVDYATDWVTVNLTGLATESWVTAGFYPLTGNPSSFLTASALTPYLTSATAASTYQTISGMSSYLTTSAAAAGYYPLSGNPSGFLTSASLSGYATESWVTGQGYITSAALTPYLTSATAASTYQTLSGMSSYLTTSAAASTYQTLAGMSDYLAKAGNLAGLANTGTARTNLGLGSLAVVNDAPSDGSQYARKNGAWDVVTTTPDYITSVSSPLSVTSGNLTIDLSAYAPLASPAFTGNPTAPTATFGDNDTSLATTAFVQSALAGGTAVARDLEVEVRNQSGSTIAAGSIVYISGATGNKPLITLAQANNDANSAQTIGFVKTAIANNGTGYVIVRGELENIDTSALTEGVQLYLSPTTAGTWTTTKPSAPQHLVYVGIVIRSHPTLGTILVAVQNGYELDELHDVAIASKANNNLLAYESSTDLWKNKTYSALGLLTSADAASTYQTLAGMSSYLTTSAAASTYQTQAGMSSYLTTATASTTYALKTNGELKGNFTLDGTTASPNSDGTILIGSLSSGYSYLYVGAGDIQGRTFSGTASSFQLNGTSGLQLFTSGQGVRFPDTSVQTVAYPGPSGFLLKADNLSGLANTGTARTNLGLGTMATATAADYSTTTVANGLYYPLSSNPAGYLTSAPVTSVAGRTGAITLAVADVSGAAPLASPALTGTPTAPTATGGTNTTQIATTAFVTAAVPALATLSESRQFTNDTKVISPRDLLWSMLSPDVIDIDGSGMTVTNVGTISFVQTGMISRWVRPGTAGACSSRTRTFGVSQVDQNFPNASRALPYQNLNFSQRSIHSGRSYIGGITEANLTASFYYGKLEGDAVGNLVRKGIGWKMTGGAGSRFLLLQAHNGTTLSSVTSSFAVVDGVSFDWDLESDGAGNVTLYVNGSSVATSTGGPTGTSAGLVTLWNEEISSSAALTSQYCALINSRSRCAIINSW